MNTSDTNISNEESKIYKISIKRNPRYIVLTFSMVMLVLLDIALFILLKNPFFIVAAILMVLLLSYIFYILKSVLSNQITLHYDHFSYKQSKLESEDIYYKDITLAGIYADFLKMYRDNSKKLAIDDGFYIYSEKLDKYLLIGVGFDFYEELFKNLEEYCKQYGAVWKNIQKRKKITITDELREILKEKYESS